MSLIRLVVERPVATWMLAIAAAVFGLVSYQRLPLNLMPDLSYPTITVRTEIPGYAPEEVEVQISRRIEEALATTPGLVELESRSRAGMSDVILEFSWGTDMNKASQSIREQLQTTFLPDDADRPLILRFDPAEELIHWFMQLRRQSPNRLNYQLKPHLSLLYSSETLTAKQAIAGRLTLPAPALFNRLAVVVHPLTISTDADIAAVSTLHECTLA